MTFDDPEDPLLNGILRRHLVRCPRCRELMWAKEDEQTVRHICNPTPREKYL